MQPNSKVVEREISEHSIIDERSSSGQTKNRQQSWEQKKTRFAKSILHFYVYIRLVIEQNTMDCCIIFAHRLNPNNRSAFERN